MNEVRPRLLLQSAPFLHGRLSTPRLMLEVTLAAGVVVLAATWFFGLVDIPMSNFRAGERKQPPLSMAGQQVMPNICYEDLFGEELLAALPGATLLVNLSNTAWFGDSLAQPQHLQIAQMRALETGRPMLRATNTGMTAVVLPDGRVQHVLPAFTRAALVAEVQGHTGMTPYARWGNLAVLAIALMLLAAAATTRKT